MGEGEESRWAWRVVGWGGVGEAVGGGVLVVWLDGVEEEVEGRGVLVVWLEMLERKNSKDAVCSLFP